MIIKPPSILKYYTAKSNKGHKWLIYNDKNSQINQTFCPWIHILYPILEIKNKLEPGWLEFHIQQPRGKIRTR